jgi:Skp family chaperone for outer membrane proteins
MNLRLKAAATAILTACLVSSSAYAGEPPAPPAKKHAAKKAPPKPTVQDQLDQMRQELQGQIDGLKNDLANKDAQLRQAQQAAADAQAAAAKAQQAADAQQQANTENAAAVTTLQTSVTDLKANAVSLATTVSDETSAIKKSINSPSVLHYKGVNLVPGGFVAAETVWRSKATAGDINTPFTSIPYEHSDNYALSEFYGTARQSRIQLLVEGKVNWGTLRGYYEADWLGTGVTSNNNQSNSYVMRQRVIYAEAETNNRWKFAGGQMWSLLTEGRKGIPSLPADIMTPQVIDPQYTAGFVWDRQWGFRVVKSTDHWAAGVALENPQILYSATLAGNTPYAVLGSQGTGGGLYNGGISACSPTTSIVNYTNQVVGTGNAYVPVYKTVNACTNLANYSFNAMPEVVVKLAFDPKFGHYEMFGVGTWDHQTVYPGETTNSNLYGGLKDYLGNTVAPALTTAGFYVNDVALGGIGGSFRMPVIKNKLTVGAKGLYGPGVGRYGSSGLSDVTTNNFGEFAPLHNGSGLASVEITPNPRLSIYLYYGADYVGRTYYSGGTTLGAPTPAQNAAGVWGGKWAAPSAAAVGYGSPLLNNSACLTNSNPGFNGSSTGYYPGGSCGAQTRDVQEFTGGYWYDIYRGEHGRLRQGLQYGYFVRDGWSGAGGIGAKGIDNMFWTSFRYYIP